MCLPGLFIVRPETVSGRPVFCFLVFLYISDLSRIYDGESRIW
jgi:hypothetical protein